MTDACCRQGSDSSRAKGKGFMRNRLPEYCKVARIQQEVDDAQSLRFRCIADDLRITVEFDASVGREISSRDNLPTTHHLLLYCGHSLIARSSVASRVIANIDHDGKQYPIRGMCLRNTTL